MTPKQLALHVPNRKRKRFLVKTLSAKETFINVVVD